MFFSELDPDIEEALGAQNIESGEVLDLGTDPGTQAVELGRRGFTVTGTDISGDAVVRASRLAGEAAVDAEFIQDDVLDSYLERDFDLVLDRGGFHVFTEERRRDYLATIARLVRPGGVLFLKCFDEREPMEDGPYRFSEAEVRGCFENDFEVLSVKESVYYGSVEPRPRAWFL